MWFSVYVWKENRWDHYIIKERVMTNGGEVSIHYSNWSGDTSRLCGVVCVQHPEQPINTVQRSSPQHCRWFRGSVRLCSSNTPRLEKKQMNKKEEIKRPPPSRLTIDASPVSACFQILFSAFKLLLFLHHPEFSCSKRSLLSQH